MKEPIEPHTKRERWEYGPNCEAQGVDRPLPTTPCHQQKALHSPCVSTEVEPTTCWWVSPFKWSGRWKQMVQDEAHLPDWRSKVTRPLGCLRVWPAPTTPGVLGHLAAACTHFLCPSATEVQGREPRERRAGKLSGPGFWSLTPGAVSLEVGQRPAAPSPPPELLPREQWRVPGARRTQRRRYWPRRRLPRGRSYRAPRQARPAPARPRQRRGCASGEGVRRAPPSGACGRWARECCHLLTGGSEPIPCSAAGRAGAAAEKPLQQRPHLPARRGPPPRPPSSAMPDQTWPEVP